jgi:hypothetical protein
MTPKATENQATDTTTLPRSVRLIGRREHVDFPEWGLRNVRAKVDTGAYSSVLDVADYELFEVDGRPMVRVQPASRRRTGRGTFEAPVVRLVTVANSSGAQERRPLIEALVRLGPVTRRIRLTIANRCRMRCRMLLGRQALAGAFLVDVSRKDLLRSEETSR